jgi:hypothetical protein
MSRVKMLKQLKWWVFLKKRKKKKKEKEKNKTQHAHNLNAI